MKTKTLLLFFGVMLVVISCSTKTTTTASRDKTLCDSLLKINEDAYNSGDAQKIADMFTDDCLLINGSTYTWSKDSVLVFAKSLTPSLKNFKAHLGPFSVSEDMVYQEKYYTGDWVVGDVTLKGKGVSILVWIKQPDNSWKIALEKSDYSFKPF
jgi:hypothetical protein